VSCSEPHFWDTASPFYDRLPHVQEAGLDLTADELGVAVVAATAAGFALHAVGRTAVHYAGAAKQARQARAAEAAKPAGIRAGTDAEGYANDDGAAGDGGNDAPGDAGGEAGGDSR
jgi:hydrogenase small subunit